MEAQYHMRTNALGALKPQVLTRFVLKKHSILSWATKIHRQVVLLCVLMVLSIFWFGMYPLLHTSEAAFARAEE